MIAADLMTSAPLTCAPEDTLEQCLAAMWDGDCGLLPVVEHGRVLGVLTDRDIAMALHFRGARPRELEVGEVMRREPVSCAPDDAVSEALARMAEHQVRRLPVMTEGGALAGVLSLNDVALEAGPTRGPFGRPTYGDVAKALQAISVHSTSLAPVPRTKGSS